MKKLVSLLVLVLSVNAMAGMQITEWMYKGAESYASGTREGEFIEFTNMGMTAIDMTGWSYDDDKQIPGAFDLSGFGIVNSGQSVILTEAPAEEFRTNWGLGAEIKIVGDLGNPNGSNIGRGDHINLYDADENLIAKLIYDDRQGWGRRTENKSSTVPFEDLGVQTAKSGWQLASVGDIYGSWAASNGDVGNPGHYYQAIPEPATIVIFGAAAAILGLRKKQA